MCVFSLYPSLELLNSLYLSPALPLDKHGSHVRANCSCGGVAQLLLAVTSAGAFACNPLMSKFSPGSFEIPPDLPPASLTYIPSLCLLRVYINIRICQRASERESWTTWITSNQTLTFRYAAECCWAVDDDAVAPRWRKSETAEIISFLVESLMQVFLKS